jgi:hypothetical protein
MPLRPCIVCGTISDETRCEQHRRGTTTQRGYDAYHKAERAAWAPIVATGTVECRRAPYGLCVAPSPTIGATERWHLGHPDAACPAAKAPEHEVCNSGAPRRQL